MSVKQKNKSFFTKFELILWLISVFVVTVSFFFGGDDKNILTLLVSNIGVTALILTAKGNLWGQVLLVFFAIIYAIISYELRYFGEMITYVGMSLPIAVASVVTWIKNPYKNQKNQVAIAKLNKPKTVLLILLSIVVTIIFYFILKYFNTANLIVSTISVLTSFLAASLMMLRNPWYALAYCANDLVLIILWVSACFTNLSYIPMVLCFVMFFFNDIYGFYSWREMYKLQNQK